VQGINAGQGGAQGAGLARTGSDLAPLALAGTVLVGLGAVLVRVRRSRRHQA